MLILGANIKIRLTSRGVIDAVGQYSVLKGISHLTPATAVPQDSLYFIFKHSLQSLLFKFVALRNLLLFHMPVLTAERGLYKLIFTKPHTKVQSVKKTYWTGHNKN